MLPACKFLGQGDYSDWIHKWSQKEFLHFICQLCFRNTITRRKKTQKHRKQVFDIPLVITEHEFLHLLSKILVGTLTTEKIQLACLFSSKPRALPLKCSSLFSFQPASGQTRRCAWQRCGRIQFLLENGSLSSRRTGSLHRLENWKELPSTG